MYFYDYESGEYKILELTADQLAVLPWAGEIKFGGPHPGASDNFLIARDFDIQFGWNSLTINGIDFTAPILESDA